MASSSSCLSSERTSRSPVIGLRASTSSPSTAPRRGNKPSSRPTRHTTRCGTDRIGTIVQTVSVPVRKLARVGRPARWLRSSARTSGSRMTVSACGPAVRSTSANSRCSWLVCHASCEESPSSVRVSNVTPSVSAANHSCSGRASVSESTAFCRRLMYSANWPANWIRLLLTSSRGSVASIQAPESSDIATPASTRSMPNRHVLWTKSTPKGRRCC